MAFDTAELRHSSWIPFNSPIAMPTNFEAYFTTIPKCLQPNQLEIFGKNGSKIGGWIDKGINMAKDAVMDKLTGPGVATNVRFRVQAADLPAYSYENAPRFTHGPVRQVPFGVIYPTIVIEAIESDQFDIRKFFDKWLVAATGKCNKNSKTTSSRYEPRYYDDIVAEFTIVAFGANGLPQGRWTFKEAYPMSVSASQMNWGSTNTYVVIPVEIMYHEWEFKELDLTDILSDPAYAAAVGKGLVKGVMGSGSANIGGGIAKAAGSIF